MTRRPFTLAKLLTVTALTLALTGPALAFRQPDPSPLEEKAHRNPDLYIGNVYKQPADLPSVGAARAAQDLQSLGVAPEHARVDRRTGRWGTLLPVEPLLPGHANALSWGDLGIDAPATRGARQQAAWDAFAGWVSRNAGALRIDPAELRQPGNVTVHDDGGYIQIHAPRQIGGVPVRDSYLTAVISGGNLILFGAHNWGDVVLPPAPAVTSDEARDVVLGHAAPFTPAGRGGKPYLEYVPLSQGGVDPDAVALGQGLTYRLAWVLRTEFAEDVLAEWEGLVDAVDGSLLAFEDKANYASTRQIIGGVYPVTNDGVSPGGSEVVYPLPYADITVGGQTFFSDSGGNLQACVDGSINSTLTGRFVDMIDNCGAVNENTAGDVLDLGTSGGTDCTVPPGRSAGDTHATRTGYYELNRIQEMARGQLPGDAAANAQLPATMNINNQCNATGGAGGVNFFRSGGGCSNTGELAGVFDHEWGHYYDALDANPGISNPGEGIADIYASLRLNASCIGHNFRPGFGCGGYGDPCVDPDGAGPEPVCSGVRDIDWANRASGNPHDIAFIDAACGGGPAPCGGSVHCEGAVYAESVWDVWNRDLQSVYGLSTDTAREIAQRLTFRGATLVGTWYNCVNGTGTGDGCNANGGYLNYLAADDDDGNLTNGTPHMEAIFDAFDRHDIACPTPTVQTSGCAGAPTTAPTVTATGLDRSVHLSWTSVTGADTYRVYRTEGEFGCDFGKILLAEVTGTTFTDLSGAENGREYYYQVVAVGDGDTCFGPMSSCTSVTPTAGPNLAVAESSALQIFTGDGDAFLDNCENGRIYFPVTNIGAGSQTDVRIVSVSSPSHPGIDASVTFPAVIAPSLVACGETVAHFDFRATGLAHNDTLELVVEVTSDELDAQLSGQVRTQTFSVPFTESDLAAPATQNFTFESGLDGWVLENGTFNRVGGGGGGGSTFSLQSSNAIDNACDRIRSPLLGLSPTSTLSLQNNYDIEPFSGGTWYDRANVALVGSDGSRVVVNPTGGRLYNAGPGGPGSYSGCNDPEMGWADANATWGASTWNAGAFGGVAPSPLVQLQVTYGTDGALAERGFWFDQVSVTDASLQVPDTQSNTCGANPLIFADGFESGDTSAWSTAVP